MADIAAFPALARAKKIFLQRKSVAKRSERGTIAGSNANRRREISSSNDLGGAQGQLESVARVGSDACARRYTALIASFCSDFDGQLRVMNSDVLLLSTSTRREYQRESIALEKLTSELLDGQVHGVKTPATVQGEAGCCRVRLRARKPIIKLRVARQTSVKLLRSPKNPPISPKVLGRAALLAHQAMKASVLQAYTRFYLYRCLYSGGPSQLTATVHLATRCLKTRAFRQWRRVATHRAKLRLRCRRAQQRIANSAASWARSRAVEILASEGKYATAKEFHQTKLTAKTFQTWLGWFGQQGSSQLLHQS
ncbi:hypothetical protein PRNP1_015118 [Phytophthora ramorum]